MPLWQATDERPELVVALGREGAHFLPAALDLVREEVILQRGVELGLEEGEEEVEDVYCVCVCISVVKKVFGCERVCGYVQQTAARRKRVIQG